MVREAEQAKRFDCEEVGTEAGTTQGEKVAAGDQGEMPSTGEVEVWISKDPEKGTAISIVIPPGQTPSAEQQALITDAMNASSMPAEGVRNVFEELDVVDEMIEFLGRASLHEAVRQDGAETRAKRSYRSLEDRRGELNIITELMASYGVSQEMLAGKLTDTQRRVFNTLVNSDIATGDLPAYLTESERYNAGRMADVIIEKLARAFPETAIHELVPTKLPAPKHRPNPASAAGFMQSIMTQAGIMQSAVAEALGCTSGKVSRMLSSETRSSVPDFKALIAYVNEQLAAMPNDRRRETELRPFESGEVIMLVEQYKQEWEYIRRHRANAPKSSAANN